MKSSEECFAAFRKIKAELPNYPLDSQTEADTRARLVSRMLHEVLDWPHENVNREENANPGFMDYVLLTNRRIAVIEAKKSGDSFLLPKDVSTAKNLTLGGILRTVKNLNEYIGQVSTYCFQNGIEYAAVSNGLQYVIFRAVRNDGIHIGQGRVIVFNGFEDLEKRFIEFWNLLAKQNVEQNSLRLAFQASEAAIFHYKRLTEEIRRYKEKVSRNSLALALEPLIGEYLGEITDEVSRERLKTFFVKSRALGEALDAVGQRISLHLSETIRRSATVIEPARQEDLRKGIKHRIDTHLTLPAKGTVLLLLGRVGSGKTTFANHFMKVELKDIFERHILGVVDFRLLEKGGDVSKFFYQALHESLTRSTVFRNLTSKQLRQVYSTDIHALTKGPLAAVEKLNKKVYEERIAEYLFQQYSNLEVHYAKVLRYLATHENIRSVFIFDNVDQHDFELQQEAFRLAHSVAGKCLSLSVVPMWEETFYKSRQAGALSAYPTTSAYAIPPTSVVAILDRRLEAIVSELKQPESLARRLVENAPRHADVNDFLTLIRDSIYYQIEQRKVRFFLESLAMGNLRRALELFALFLTSGHTDVDKILTKHRSGSGYRVPLHEVIKSIGLGEYRYYHGDVSPALNLYSISDEARPSHFTKIRLLAYLSHHRHHSSSFGLGFVRTEILKDEFHKIGTSETDIAESLGLLVGKSLVENDSYEKTGLRAAYRITPAGRYYIRFLAVRFAYLDLVLQDTPIADHVVVEAIAHLIDSKDLVDRFERVDLFLSYLINEELREHTVIAGTSDSIPLRRKLIGEMLEEFQNERNYIRKRTIDKGYAGGQEFTPYEVLPTPPTQ